MPDAPALQYINIRDFTPGIRHRHMNTAAVGSFQPPGAADVDGTFKCIALPGGGLGPLPKRTISITPTAPDTLNARIKNQRFIAAGLHASGQFTLSGSAQSSALDHEVHLLLEYIYDQNNDGAFTAADLWKTRWQRYKRDATWDTILASTRAYVAGGPTSQGAFINDAVVIDDSLGVTLRSTVNEVLATSDNFNSCVFPDPTAPNALGVSGFSVGQGGIAIQHQGRFVILYPGGGLGHGSAAYTDFGLMLARFSSTYTVQNLTLTTPSVFKSGDHSGFGAVASISAQELLIINHRGGAISITGDISDPTVYNLPSVTPTNGARVIGCHTPAGFVYGSKYGGVHAWQGGDKSVLLSPQLSDGFWDVDTTQFDMFNFDGKFDHWGSWLVCPNNYLFDFITESWWKVEDSTSLNIFQWAVAPGGRYMYGVPVAWTNTALPLVYGWDKATPGTSWSWRSQPITPSIDRVIDVREVSFHAVGPANSTITITLSNEAGETQAEVVTLTSATLPKLYQARKTRLRGTGIKVRIEASGGASEAPSLYGINIGWREASGVGQTLA